MHRRNMHLFQKNSNILTFNSLLLILNTVTQPVNCLSIDQNYANKHQATQEAIAKSSDAPVPAKSSLSDTRQQFQPKEQHVQVYDHRRPIWVLSHMVNSIQELDYRLGKGANAVEADVTFGSNGDPLYTYHGPPCDCWRHCNQQEDFHEYLSYVREIAIEQRDGIGRNLTVLFLDLKLDYLDFKAKARAGTELAKSVLNNLYVEAPDSSTDQNNSAKQERPVPKRVLRLILSINHVGDIELIRNFMHYMEEQNSAHLMSLIGFDVGMNDDIQMIESMWRRLNGRINIWQGDGYTNCISPFYNLKRLTKALQKRDSLTGYPNKVYHWTIDIHDRMRESLRLGVDALMTNHPERAVKVLLEPDMVQNFRLATIDDDPFRKIIRSGRGIESARFQRSAHPTSDGLFGNIMDVIASWYNYVREIPIFSFPRARRLFQGRGPMRKSNSRASTQGSTAKPSPANYTDAGNNNTLSRFDQSLSTSPTNSSTNDTTDILGKNNEPVTVSDVVDGISVGDRPTDKDSNQQEETSEGPKWYISLASNLLVSLMKIIMPADT